MRTAYSEPVLWAPPLLLTPERLCHCGAVVAGNDSTCASTLVILRERVHGRHGFEADEGSQLFGCGRQEIPIRARHRPGVSGFPEDRPAYNVCTGCAWKRKLVTTPKLPPPPRRAQNRSGCWLLLAVTKLPSARTTSASRRLSMVRPYLRVR